MRNKKIKTIIADYVLTLVIFSSVFLIIYFFVGQLFEVTGESMTPSFQNGEQLLAEKISVNFSNLKRGDVVVFKNPFENNRLLIKRVIGLSKEKFQITNGAIYVNGNKLQEDYLSEGMYTKGGRILEEGFEYTIPENSFVVLGDNREKSTDSRDWGYIKKDMIIGRAVFVYYPIKNIRIVERVNYQDPKLILYSLPSSFPDL